MVSLVDRGRTFPTRRTQPAAVTRLKGYPVLLRAPGTEKDAIHQGPSPPKTPSTEKDPVQRGTRPIRDLAFLKAPGAKKDQACQGPSPSTAPDEEKDLAHQEPSLSKSAWYEEGPDSPGTWSFQSTG
ncbi:hypothetical protein LWI28_025760 [Acer negundo]|uniref:Uncharacterized protein n=1 Tax=Acer negundo TaxID=4023 RepID=A0AAD5JKG8_ACENE|nr:hypothetical protein LWI28_025760 [Acer negundo]